MTRCFISIIIFLDLYIFTLSCIQAAGREIGLNSALLSSLYIEQAKGLNSKDMDRWINICMDKYF